MGGVQEQLVKKADEEKKGLQTEITRKNAEVVALKTQLLAKQDELAMIKQKGADYA